jgi:hypothetical protein
MRILPTLFILIGLAGVGRADVGADLRLYPSLQGISGLPGSNGEDAPHFDYWHDAWLDPVLLDGFSLVGGSGLIHSPAPQSLGNGQLSASLHSYRVAVGRGFPYGLEVGLQMDLDGLDQDPNLSTWRRRELFYYRWTPIDPWTHVLGMSVGAEGLGFRDLGFKVDPNLGLAQAQPQTVSSTGSTSTTTTASVSPASAAPTYYTDSSDGWQRYYVVVGGRLPRLPMAYYSLGYGGGAKGPGAFGSLVVAPFAGAAFVAEYDHGTDLGLRLLLSTQIKMDLSISDIQGIDANAPFDLVLRNNVRFGISYAEMWP